jgi:hypothetical protein
MDSNAGAVIAGVKNLTSRALQASPDWAEFAVRGEGLSRTEGRSVENVMPMLYDGRNLL